MDKFTKEELEIIMEVILWRDEHILPHKRPEKLKCKIYSMIDNYCEHEETVKEKICCGTKWKYVSTDWSVAKCHLCGKNLNESICDLSGQSELIE